MTKNWVNSDEAAKRILDFFGVSYTVRDHHGMKIYEGEYGGKAIWIMTTQNDAEIAIQFRKLDTRRDMGGALLKSCHEIDFRSEMKVRMTPEGAKSEEYRCVIIRSKGGEVSISRDGVHADIA